MTKLRLFGAAVGLCSMMAGPATAQHVISDPGHHFRKAFCQNRDPGNPYSERYDYQTWTAWRANGGWDSRRDWDCWHSRRRDF
jgi:hypothetical protein